MKQGLQIVILGNDKSFFNWLVPGQIGGKNALHGWLYDAEFCLLVKSFYVQWKEELHPSIL